MKQSIAAFSTGTALALLLAGPAFTADITEPFVEGPKPAVSGLNAKLDLGYIFLDPDLGIGDFHGASIIGSLSAPIGQRFGIQVDAGYAYLGGDVSDPELGGIGGHLFWRNPDVGLLGVYGHYAGIDTDSAAGTVDGWRYGLEGEAYFERISIEAFVGADTIDLAAGSDTFFNGELLGAFYLTDDLRIHAGVGHQFDDTFAKVGAEVMLPVGGNMTSLYATGTFGDETSVRAGLRIYFGESGKSLKARHREDDPRSRINDYFSFDEIVAPPAAAPVGGGGAPVYPGLGNQT